MTIEPNKKTGTFGELVAQARMHQEVVGPKAPKPGFGFHVVIGFLAGSAVGFILAVALFSILLWMQQTHPNADSQDFANPIGVILVVLVSTLVTGLVGMVVYPSLVLLMGARQRNKVGSVAGNQTSLDATKDKHLSHII